MRTSALPLLAGLALAVGAGQALAQQAQPAKTVTVVMADPGCHWFAVNGKHLKTLTVSGPVKLANFDEDALLVAGPSGVVREAVGKRITLTAGVYRIKMVKQHPDDNTLKLVVR
jgi:uncharacterized protein (DUF2345 family)